MITQTIDGITFKMKTPYDFGFLRRYGKVFTVFDDQDSGNICFGVEGIEGIEGAEGDGKKLFVKYAGAPTAEYEGEPADAIARLKWAVAVYQDLAHPHLIAYRFSEEVGGGFAAVFDWVDAECMGKQYPVSRAKFMELPLGTMERIFDDILAFHLHVINRGYVAIDFYDGSILYDFAANRTYLCDIDFYAKRPVTNTMGRMWGSSRFMSPEEFTLGAPIDELTNVFLMGAVAFALFGGEMDRTFTKWKISTPFYQVALKAVEESRAGRYPTLKEFSEAWRAAVK
ncbi:serine/threonine protein kinase [Gorillibacterium massiliense]|uniref:serine/threonine protein kinase n=1 Tax=Gorillibacterium massiliense TaxID=1280390 RepID=UPI0004AF95A8|nr:serine/threonine protein kinase [Gorillibacterium massiliense]